MALITRKNYDYSFPEVESKDAEKFNELMTKIFKHCGNKSEEIIKFLEEALKSTRKFNIDNILSMTEITKVDKEAYMETLQQTQQELVSSGELVPDDKIMTSDELRKIFGS